MTTLASRLRPDLEPLTPRLQRLPVDSRGYPVPWFVQWVDEHQVAVEPDTPNAVPEFRLMDRAKWYRAVNEGLCWVCGEVLGAYKTFVIGPMCGINRTTSEPACHLDCAEWSARNCPFLTRPHMDRRNNDGLQERTRHNVAGELIDRNPGVTLLWTTKRFMVWRDDKGAPLIAVGDPTNIRWYAEGRPATRAEVEASVSSGLPLLERMALDEDQAEGGNRAVVELARRRVQLEWLYPVVAE
jgi:hypothetical protein